MNLSEFHLEQVTKYLRFFRGKRQIQLQEIENLFDDAKESRLSDSDQVLSCDEAESLLDGLLDSVKSNVNHELSMVVNMSVLAIQQLFEDADAQDLELQMDTSKIEDARLVEEVKNISLDSTALNGAQRKKGKLTSLRDEQKRIVDENERLRIELQKANENQTKLQDKCNGLSNKLSNATFEIENLRNQLYSANQSVDRAMESKSEAEAKLNTMTGATSIQNLQEILDSEQSRANTLQAELEDAKSLLLNTKGIDFDDYNSIIKNSKQFIQLKKTLRQKSEQLTDLRRRFEAYEPDRTIIDDCTSPTQLKK